MATSVVWRDLTLATGDAAPYRLLSVEGWEGLPDARYDNLPRARGHGSHSSRVWSDQRIVTVEGFSWSAQDRDGLLYGLQRAATFDGGEEPLTVTLAGRTLTASAQLLAARPTIERGQWGIGRFGWLLQWRCPDPHRYGPTRRATTGLPTAGTGLAYPLAYPLDYGTVGATGQVTLDNEGTADAPISFVVSGGLPNGFEISAAGGRLTYPYPVPAGQSITIDTADGTVLADGTADRRGNLTYADWLTIPPGRSLTVQFTSLGGEFDPGAQLAAEWAPTYW